ncbi:MAG: tetratricopeptide repeat protein [Candidatus Hydrogenedentes bacterium]|nr:tetratricopeptide repeat protein [Candidatus Hydrogenedentota bacterium]
MIRLKHVWVFLLIPVAAIASGPAELNSQGVDFYNAGDYPRAAAAFEAARAVSPDNAVILRNLCNVYQAYANEFAKQADFASAVKQLEKAIALQPKDVSPLIQLGNYYLRLDMIPEAVFRLEQAIQVDPYNVQAHELLGEAYYRDNDLPSARTQWAWVLEQQPQRNDLKTRFEKAEREEVVENGFRPAGSLHFQMSSTPEVAGNVLQTVLALLEMAYADVGRNLGGVYPPGPIQVIVYNSKGFTDATQVRQNVGGLYDGKIRIPLLDSAGLVARDQELKETLYHEYTHVVVRFIAHSNAVWWMNEGLAETFSRPLTGSRLEMLQKAVANAALFPYAAMEESQLKKLDSDALWLAYTQSHATLLYLWERFGQAKLVELFNALAIGTKTEDALIQVYNRNYDHLYVEVAQFIQNGCR